MATKTSAIPTDEIEGADTATHQNLIEERARLIARLHEIDAQLGARGVALDCGVEFRARTPEALEALVSEIVHDIRHPLATLQGSAQLLAQHWDEEATRTRCIEQIAGGVIRLDSLLGELTQFNRPADVCMTPVGAAALIEDAITATTHLVRERRIELVRDFDPAKPRILGLSNNLVEAFVNLIDNACHAMEPGGRLKLTIRGGLDDEHAQRVRDRFSEPERYMMIAVADTGCGIAEEMMGRIFSRFFTTKSDGQGLGLAAAKRILDANLCHIHVESQTGAGTVFHIYLPRAA